MTSRRKRGRIVRWALGVTLAAAIVIACLGVAGKFILPKYVLQKRLAEMGLDLSWSRLSFDPLTLQYVLTDVHATHGGVELFRASRLQADAEVTVHGVALRATLQKPVFKVVRSREGELRIPKFGLSGPAGGGGGIPFTMSFIGGHVDFQDEQSGLSVSIDDVSAVFSRHSPIAVSLQSPSCTIVYGQHRIESRVRVDASLDRPIHLDRIDIRGVGFVVSIRDQALDLASPRFRLSGQADLDPLLRALGAELPKDRMPSGLVTFEGDVDGPLKTVALRMTSTKLQAGGVEMTRLTGEATLSAGARMSFRGGGSIAGGTVEVRAELAHDLGRAAILLDHVEVGRFAVAKKALPIQPAAVVTGDVGLAWLGLEHPRGVRAEISLELAAGRPTPGTVPLAGEIHGSYANGALRLAQAHLRAGTAAVVDAEGTIARGAVDVSYDATLLDPRGSLLFAGIHESSLPREIVGTVKVTGHIGGDGNEIAGRFEAPSLLFQGLQFERIAGAFSKTGARIEIPEAVGTLFGGRVAGRGTIDQDFISMILSGESLQFTEMSPVLTEGTVGFSAEGSGTLADPAVIGSFRVDGLATASTVPEDLTGDFTLNRNSIAATFRSATSDLGGTAWMDLAAPHPFRLSADFSDLPLSKKLTQYRDRKDLSLVASGHFDATAQLDVPHCPSAEVRIEDVDVRVSEVGLRNEGEVSANIWPDAVLFRKLTMVGAARRFDLKGMLPLGEAQRASIDLDGKVDLEVLEFLSPGLHAAGTLEGQAHLTGVGATLAGNGRLILSGGEAMHPKLPLRFSGVSGEFDLVGDQINLVGVGGNVKEGRFQASGSVPLSALPIALLEETRREIQVDIAMQGFGSGNFEFIPPKLLRFSTDAQVRLGGSFRSFDAITMNGTLANTQMSAFGQKLTDHSSPAALEKRGTTITMRGLDLTGDGVHVQGDAEIRRPAGEPAMIEASLHATAENRILSNYAPQARFGGSALADVKVTGQAAAPLLNGVLTVTDGSVSVPTKNIDLKAVSAQVDFTGRAAQLTATGLFNGGRVETTGDAAFDGLHVEEISADTAIYGCGTFYPEGLQGKLDGRLSLSRDREGFRLDGDVWLRNGEYRKNLGISGMLAGFIRKEEQSPIGLLPDVQLNLNIALVDFVSVRNDIAKMRLRGEISVQGTPSIPRLYGRIESMPDGQFTIAGHIFRIQTCSLDFEGDPGIDPRVDVEATASVSVNLQRASSVSYEIPKHSIKVILTGKLSKTDLHLVDEQGQPPLSETECASVLLTGQVLGEGSLGSKEQFRGQMTSLLGGGIGNTFLPAIGRKLGVDQFDIQPNYISNLTDSTTTRAVIGKDLGGGFFFTYAPDLSNSQRYIWTLDYQAGHNVGVRVGRQDDASYIGGATHNVGFNLLAGRHEQPPLRMSGAGAANQSGKQIIAEIVIEGLRATDPSLVQRQLTFHVGEELDYPKIYESQRRLYALHLFRSARIYPQNGQLGFVTVRVSLAEQDTYQFTYGLRYNTQGKIGGKVNTQNPAGIDGEVELHNVNVFGKGINAGIYTRQSRPEKRYQFTLNFPYILGRRLDTSMLVSQQNLVDPGLFGTFVDHLLRASVQVKQRLNPRISLEYFANYKRTLTKELNPIGHPPIRDFDFTRARVGMSISADLRDDSLNAKRGLFCSSTFEWQPEQFHVQLSLLRSFNQIALYYTVLDKVTIAVNNRFGVVYTPTDILANSDAFYSGGGSSVRSYRQDYLGPHDPSLEDRPLGGRAVVVYNQEVRFPIHSLTKRIQIGGVLFHDAGNVFRNISEFRPFDVKSAVGFGIRLDTPYSLFRFDYASTVNPGPTDDRNRFVFSLGQMF